MKLSVREICIFGMIGAVMYVSKIAMEFLPNVHLIGTFITALTLVYRQKALYPLYVFILLVGFLNGFSVWWIPYLYIWAVLWAMVMLIPQKMSPRPRYLLAIVATALHGYLYGTLYAPAQAILFHYSIQAMVAWIISGLPWDFVHGTSNLICGSVLIYPLTRVFTRNRQYQEQ